MLRIVKNSGKFVYILAKQCRSHFNLTNFLTKNFKILILRRFEIFTKISLLKLVGTPCMYVIMKDDMASLFSFQL